MNDPTRIPVEGPPTDADGPGRALVADPRAGVAAVAAISPDGSLGESQIAGLEQHERTLREHLKVGATISDLATVLDIAAHEVIGRAEALAVKLSAELEQVGVGVERRLLLRSDGEPGPR